MWGSQCGLRMQEKPSLSILNLGVLEYTLQKVHVSPRYPRHILLIFSGWPTSGRNTAPLWDETCQWQSSGTQAPQAGMAQPGANLFRQVRATKTCKNPCAHMSARWWSNPMLVVAGLTKIQVQKSHKFQQNACALGLLDACRLRALVPLTGLIPCTIGQTKVITSYADSHLYVFFQQSPGKHIDWKNSPALVHRSEWM